MTFSPGHEPQPSVHRGDRFGSRIVACYLHPITKHGYPPPAEGAHDHLRDLHALGFDAIELEGIHEPHLREVHAMRHELRATVDRLGVRVPYFCVVLPGLASADPDVRRANLALFELGCETAVALGADGVLDNGPLPPYAFPDELPVVRHYDQAVLARATLPASLDWERYWRDLVGAYREACDLAAGYGLTFQIHPAIGVLCATTDGFLRFRDAVDRDALRFVLDTANQFVQRESLPLALTRLAGHVDYVHLSDAGGTRSEHLAIGEGAIDWEAFFGAVRRTGFAGRFGIDVGGAESGVEDLDGAYRASARWVRARLERDGGPGPIGPSGEPR